MRSVTARWADWARDCDPPADPAALRPSAGRALVVDLSFGAGLTCVPALSGHPFWLVAPCVAVAGLIVPPGEVPAAA